jgi:hypothetical protein
LHDGGSSREGTACASGIVPDGMQTAEHSKNLPFEYRDGIAVKQFERGVQFGFRFGGRSP